MYSILLALGIMLPTQHVAHTLPYEVDWKTEVEISKDIKLKSTLRLKQWQIKKTERMLKDIGYLFFNRFERHLEPKCSARGALEIRIISEAMITDKRYFEFAQSTNFGRYFSWTNTLYIAHDVFWNPRWLAHEMAHYYYDECNVKFDNPNDEHSKVYMFQDIYRDWAR